MIFDKPTIARGDNARNALAPTRRKPCMPTGLTLAQGRPYTSAVATDVRTTWQQFAPPAPAALNTR